jgi:PadR family transcriptional regulator PadR
MSIVTLFRGPANHAWRGAMSVSDIDTANKKFRKELNSGTVSLVLLGVLGRASEPMYGYQIAKRIDAPNGSAPMMKQGALYPVLRSLEAGGLLASRVEPSVSGPPRRYYGITDAGREALAQWEVIWSQTKTFVDEALKGIENV